MHPLTELLLKRVESHPEEFMGANPRWNDILDRVKTHAPSEHAVLKESIGKLYMDREHERALKRLMGQDPKDPVEIERKKREKEAGEARVREAEIKRYQQMLAQTHRYNQQPVLGGVAGRAYDPLATAKLNQLNAARKEDADRRALEAMNRLMEFDYYNDEWAEKKK